MTVIDVYLAEVPEPQKSELERVRQLVRRQAAEAEEVISYGMPGFKYKGRYLCGFNAFKDHLSFFPTSEPIEVFADKLKGYKISRGTIQFTVEKPLPARLIKEIVDHRIKTINKE